MDEMLLNIIIATLAGFISRYLLLRIDFRQYPTYPNGYLIHLSVGFVAAAVGAISIPALLFKDYTAVTFLFLAIQHFRDVRRIEMESLDKLEPAQYHPRGSAYIDGIAKTFESRNYLATIVSLTTSTLLLITQNKLPRLLGIGLALSGGFLIHILISNFAKGKLIKDIAEIEIGQISCKDHNLYVNDYFVANVGVEVIKNRILQHGIGIIIKPRGENEKIMLNNLGQQKAIEHECARLLGLERHLKSYRDFASGNIVLVIVAIRKEPQSLVHIIKHVPVLEIVKKQAAAKEKM